MSLAIAAAVCAAYFWAVPVYRRRHPNQPFSIWRGFAFATGALLMGAVLLPGADALVDRSFAWHMAQHVVLTLIGPPLILLGAPLLLLLAAPAPAQARAMARIAHHPAMHVLLSPMAGWLVFVAVLWGVHFSPLYETALENGTAHVLEHVIFIGAAFLFWMPVVQAGYAPRPVAFPVRMLYLVLMFPQGAFLGLAIYASGHVIYPHYAAIEGAAAALRDQQNGGAVMWIAGGFIMFLAFMLVAASWAQSERHAPIVTTT